jgi:E3 ubiquitin-protein ligase RNF115/126
MFSCPTTDVFCPRCFARFLHEIDPPARPSLAPPHFIPHPFHPQHHQHDGYPRCWVIYGGGPTITVPGRAFRQPPPARRRVPSPPPPPVARRPSTPPAIDPGDYFTGHNLNGLIDELTQNDRPGPPRAASSAIDSLPTVRITGAHLADGSQCPVCKGDFELGEAARQLPCKHVYHSDCIVPWLRLHNTCPVCRYQLPGGAPNTSGGGNSNREPFREQPTMVRWGPFSWLWPPRGLDDDSDDEWSMSGTGGRRRPTPAVMTALQSFFKAQNTGTHGHSTL